MSNQNFIDKDNISPYHIDIKQLYREGLNIIQGYAGDRWTDYNEHDPGVTILEQLVFAITDLCYKMGFNTVDYLVGENNQIDTNRQALFEADEILTTHPVTIEDYRKVIFDRIPDVSNVWIDTLPEEENNGIPGLYRIYLYLDPAKYYAFQAAEGNKLEEYEESQKKLLHNLWPTIRNIGEDLDQENITVLGQLNVFIYADLVVKNSGNLEEILAEIIFAIDQYFNPILVMSTLEDLLEEGYTYDQIFDGPKLDHGFIQPEALGVDKPVRITKAKLVSIISEIEGIRQIENLSMKYEVDGELYDVGEVLEIDKIDPHKIPRFKFLKKDNEASPNDPKDDNPQLMDMGYDSDIRYLTVKLRKRTSKKYLELDFDRVKKTLRKKQALQNRVYSSTSESDHKATLPKGEYHDWSYYYSIQNHFPAIYAINQYGLSKKDSPRRQAMALQLKGFMILLEQLIADFQNQMAHLKDLYSIDRSHLNQTYYPRDLLKSEIKDIEELYDHETDDFESDSEKVLEKVMDKLLNQLNEIHPHIERKSRVLDYMLALYGEKFAQHTLGRVGDHRKSAGNPQKILENKVRMLESLRLFSANAPKAPTFGSNRTLEDLSGFEMKLAVLLGISMNTVLNTDGNSIFSIYQDKYRRISLVPDHKWEKVAHGKLKNIKKLMEEGRLQSVSTLTGAETEYIPEDKDLMRNYLIGEKIITTRLGVDPHNYFLYQSNKFNQYYLLIKIHTKDYTHWHIIGSCEGPEEALKVVKILTGICKDYQRERFIFLDHIKLRPINTPLHEEMGHAEFRDFYAFNSTLVFPNWGGKFQDEAYQQLTEDTVTKIIPAHVRVNVLWLNFLKFREFEKIFNVWSSDPDHEYHRHNMVHFLVNNLKKQESEA